MSSESIDPHTNEKDNEKILRFTKHCGFNEDESFFVCKMQGYKSITNKNAEFVDDMYEHIYLTEEDIKALSTPITTAMAIGNPLKYKKIEYKAKILLKESLEKDLTKFNSSEIIKIRQGFFKSIKVPIEWATRYQNVYDSSNKVLSGVLQNFFIRWVSF